MARAALFGHRRARSHRRRRDTPARRRSPLSPRWGSRTCRASWKATSPGIAWRPWRARSRAGSCPDAACAGTPPPRGRATFLMLSVSRHELRVGAAHRPRPRRRRDRAATSPWLPSCLATSTARRMSRRSTYPRPSFDGKTPSATRNVKAREWSPMTRRPTSLSSGPRRRDGRSAPAAASHDRGDEVGRRKSDSTS